MVYPDSAMARCDPSSDKENLVPRVHRNEPGSGGLGSVRTRGLMSSEQRLHTVLKESALQNQTPAAVTASKTNLGSTEKEWLKDVLFDYSGKQSAGSLERLKEKIGQLKSVNALKPVPLKTTAAFDHHSVGELSSRGLSPTVSEAVVHVYRDDKVSKPGGIQRETVKVESQRYHRDSNHRNNSLRVHEHNLVEHDVHDRGKPSSLLTPTKPSAGKENESLMQSHGSSFSRGTPFKKKPSGSDSIDNSRRSVQNKVDSVGHFTSEKQAFSSEVKSVVVQDLQGKYSLAGETSRLTSPLEEEAKSSRENSVELHAIPSSALVDKIIKRAKISSFGPALRVRRDDPRAYAKAEYSPDSEKSADYDHKYIDALHASHTMDSHANVHTLPKVSEAGTISSGKSNQRVHQNVALQTDDDFLNEHRKRKAETDPSTTDTSNQHLAVGIDKHVSVAVATEAREVVNKGGNSVHRECEGRRGSMEKENRAEPTALEPSGERWIEDIAGHPLTGSCTKGTPGHEREPWAWKTARDARGLTLPSPTSHEHSKCGKVIGGIPPRYVPPVLESRERKAEENDSPASDGLKHHPGVLKQINEIAKSEPINGVIPQSNLRVKGLADDNAVHHLSNTFSTISFEEKIASGVNGADKTSTQGRTQTHISEHHVISVPAESGSNTGVTGVTGLTALTSPNGLNPHKTAVTLSHGVELQQKPHSQQPPREGDLGINMPDHSALPKSTCRATVPAAEISVHDVNEGHSAKASDSSKDRGEKNQEIAHHNPQPARKLRTEAESQKFVFVNGIRYQKLGKIGKGGSSEVFKVIATDCSIYAVKRINLKGRDWSTAQEFYQEIKYLKALRGKRHIIQLIDSEVTNKKVLEERSESGDITEDACIYMVLEYGEIDLAGMLSAKRKEIQSNNETEPDENWLRFYWQQILKAVKTIHDERIVHSDLKPANFMLVRGELKLIDFGIAKAIQNDTTNIVKENQTGTLNYMAPEAFLANQTDDDGLEIKIGRASDIWSLGCIFFQMVYGQTPFAELPLYSKIQAITNPHHRIQYPRTSNPWLLDIIKRCLTWDRRKRLRIPELLEHRFLRPQTAPYGF